MGGAHSLPETITPYPVVANIDFAEGPIFDDAGNLYFVNYLESGTLGQDGARTARSRCGCTRADGSTGSSTTALVTSSRRTMAVSGLRGSTHALAGWTFSPTRSRVNLTSESMTSAWILPATCSSRIPARTRADPRAACTAWPWTTGISPRA